MSTPFDIAFAFLKKAQEMPTSWERALHQNHPDTSEEERIWPSFRHVREREDELLQDYHDEDMQDYKNQLLQETLDSILLPDTPPPKGPQSSLEEEKRESLERVKQQVAAGELPHITELQDRLRNRKIDRIIGRKPEPLIPSSTRPSLITGTTTPEQVLLEALRSGDNRAYENLQAQFSNPLIGDMPLSDFEKVHSAEMEVPERGAPVAVRRPGNKWSTDDQIRRMEGREWRVAADGWEDEPVEEQEVYPPTSSRGFGEIWDEQGPPTILPSGGQGNKKFESLEDLFG